MNRQLALKLASTKEQIKFINWIYDHGLIIIEHPDIEKKTLEKFKKYAEGKK